MSGGEPVGRDLIVVVPDDHFRTTVVSLLTHRRRSLRIGHVDFAVAVLRTRDPGCLRTSPEFLRRYLPTHRHALVIFDRSGCGQDTLSSGQLEAQVEAGLARSGWEGRAAAIVLDPELEAWVWSDSPKVAEALGWSERRPSLRDWLQATGLWPRGEPKPPDPKNALARALEAVDIPVSARIFAQLARSVGVTKCTDRAFLRLCEILQRWFPAQGRQSP